MRDIKPGDLGAFDPAFAARHYRWLARLHGAWFGVRVGGLDRLPPGPFLSVGHPGPGPIAHEVAAWMTAYHNLVKAPPLLAQTRGEVFDLAPLAIGKALARLGALRPKRDLALEALTAGFAVHTVPGREERRFGPLLRRHRVQLAGQTDYVTLAIEAGVPIVPIASIGAPRLLPRPSQITLEVLTPVDTTPYAPDDARDPDVVRRVDFEVRARLQQALNRLARGRLPLVGDRCRR